VTTQPERDPGGVDERFTARDILPVVPLALAIAIFGTIYGAVARPLLGVAQAVLSSALIFSGSVQFAVLGLLFGGAPPVALLLTALTLNLRNLVLGAVLRARISGSPLKRAGLSWFLIDETVGLAVQPRVNSGRIVLVAGLICYFAWTAGTVVGLFGATVGGLRGMAEALFPVLFVGLATISARDRGTGVRALVAALVTVVLVKLWPAARGVVPVIAALTVATTRKTP
jgi:branched chain amino acid efflux pump